MKSRCATVPGRSHILDSWSHRLAWPRTEPSQGLNTGSNPVGTTSTYAIPENERDASVTRRSGDNSGSVRGVSGRASNAWIPARR